MQRNSNSITSDRLLAQAIHSGLSQLSARKVGGFFADAGCGRAGCGCACCLHDVPTEPFATKQSCRVWVGGPNEDASATDATSMVAAVCSTWPGVRVGVPSAPLKVRV